MLDLFEKDFMVLLWKQNILIDWYVFLTLYLKIYLKINKISHIVFLFTFSAHVVH